MEKERTVLEERMKYYRKLRGMSQEDLAEASGINISTIKKYESGFRKPKMEQIAKIAEALEVSTTAFIDLDIKTVSDVMAVLMNLDDQLDLEWTGKKDKKGNYIPGSVSIGFKNKDLCKVLAEYLDSKEASPSSAESTDYTVGDIASAPLEKKSFKPDENKARLLLYNQLIHKDTENS